MGVEEKLKSRNNGFGPVSVKRNAWASLAVAFFCSASFVCILAVRYFIHGVESKKILTLDDIVVACGAVSALLTGELVRRLCLFVEERRHVESRYLGSYSKALDACFCVSSLQATLVVYISASVLFLIFSFERDVPFSTSNYFVVAVCYIVVKQRLPAKSLATAEVSDMNEQDNKNIASGLAWSYYFGYLKLVVPGFQKMIADAVAPRHTLNGKDLRDCLLLPQNRKLFIIIPNSCHCYDDLRDVDKRISFAANMPDQTISRGGVNSRIYKQSLYSICIDGKEPVYAMLEYATPLMTMYEMMKNARAGISVRDIEEQVVLFVRTLKDILSDDPDVGSYVHLLLVRDVHDDLAESIVRAMGEERLDFE